MIYRYKVEYYNQIDEKEDTATGIVCKETYGAAAHYLTEQYGEDDIESLYLAPIVEWESLEIAPEILDGIVKENEI